MFKRPHQVYTADFKDAAAQRVQDEQGLSAVARTGNLNGPGANFVTAE